MEDPCDVFSTGIDYTHPALGGGFGPGHKVTGGYDLVGDDYDGESWLSHTRAVKTGFK